MEKLEQYQEELEKLTSEEEKALRKERIEHLTEYTNRLYYSFSVK